MNIWDELSYKSDGRVTGGWKINFYQYPQLGAQYGSGQMIEELDFELTPDESKQLTLGWGPELGGDYIEDEDFWIDVESFLDEYKDIPQRLLDHINNLPEYEQITDTWEPMALSTEQ
jgi:hypothetical protein